MGVDGMRSNAPGGFDEEDKAEAPNEASAKTKSFQVHFIFTFPFTDSVEVLPRGQYRTCRRIIDASVKQ